LTNGEEWSGENEKGTYVVLRTGTEGRKKMNCPDPIRRMLSQGQRWRKVYEARKLMGEGDTAAMHYKSVRREGHAI